MSGYYNEQPPKWNDARWVWAGIALVCVLAVLGNVTVWLVLRESPQDQETINASVQGGVQGPSSDSGSEQPAEQGSTTADSAVADCRARWLAQAEPLQAATASIQQWRTHIDAMNKLVAGQISLTQATAFWNQTRKGAMHRIAHFEAKEQRYERQNRPCDTKRSGDTSLTDMTPRDRRCVRATLAGDRVLSRAKTAINTWTHHVHDMEMLRTGKLSATQAAQMWQMNWQMGQDELMAYDHASARTLALRCS